MTSWLANDRTVLLSLAGQQHFGRTNSVQYYALPVRRLVQRRRRICGARGITARSRSRCWDEPRGWSVTAPRTFSLPFRGKVVDSGRWCSSEVFGGHMRSVPYGAVAALCCCTPLSAVDPFKCQLVMNEYRQALAERRSAPEYRR